MRSLYPADAVHKGFGTIPTSILQRKNGVCIYERPACYNRIPLISLEHFLILTHSDVILFL